MTDMTWQDDGACANGKQPHALFFPIKPPGRVTPEYRAAVAKAVRVCASCPIQERCLRFAIDEGLDYGIYGGMTAEARKEERLRRGERRPHGPSPTRTHGTEAAYKRHLRHGETPCDDCVKAHRVSVAESKQRMCA